MKKQSTEMRLAQQIRAGKNFTVETNSQRNRALAVARMLEIDIVTRQIDGGYQIIIPKG